MPIQPLSKVLPQRTGMLDLHIMPLETMTQRPELGVLIAETIAVWAQVECALGIILAVILETEAQTALAMFSSLTSSSNQMTVVSSAAKAKLNEADEELFSAIMMLVRSAAKDRHKYAHWCWAFTTALPEALLLIEPDKQATWFANILGYHDTLAKIDHDDIFVLRLPDATETVERVRSVKNWLGRLLGVFVQKDRGTRAELRQTLSSEPPILEALDRLRKARKSNP
jgi:hypothetical protein